MSEIDESLLEIDFENVPFLGLAEYRALLQGIPAPTDGQIADFAAYVSDAKSWYKHLSPFPPGAPFHFFVDPCAGLDRVRLPGPRAEFFLRTEDSSQFHHSWMTTEAYRERFGYLSFCCEHGSAQLLQVVVQRDDGGEEMGFLDNNPSRPLIYPTTDQPFRIPRDVLDSGRALITGVVHSVATSVWFWRMALSPVRKDVTWAEETGGASTIARIRQRCAALPKNSEMADSSAADPEIEVLVRLERERMQNEMVLAMRRMRHLVFAGA